MAERGPTGKSKHGNERIEPGDGEKYFQPKWRDQRSDGMCLSDDKDQRTPHPATVPEEVLDATAASYRKKIPRIQGSNSRSFTLFSKLPPELRLIIWAYSLPAGRIVEILYDHDRGVCKSTCPIPSTLSVNHESRLVALKAYKKRFGTSKAPPMTYFDSSVDTLFIGEYNLHPNTWDTLDPANTFFDAISQEDRDSIYHLAIDITICLFFENSDEPEQKDYFGLWYLDTLTEISPKGNYDIIFCNALQAGEIHAWSMSPGGRAMPWFLREDENAESWEADLSVNWCNLEYHMQDNKRDLLTTHRCVSQRRLLKDPRFRKRMLFMEEVVEVLDCVYAKDGIIEKIMDWKANAPLKYTELVVLFRGIMGEAYDAEALYTAETPCSCPSRHEALTFPQDLEMRKKVKQIDFRAAVNRIERLRTFEGLGSGDNSST